MVRANPLQPGSIVPVAKPVDQFVNWNGIRAARPAELPRMAGANQIQTVGRGSVQNVQGRNPIADLALALKPLTQLADTGLQMYASNEYKKGQNEVLKASALLNKQMLASGQEYAAQNRALSRQDPVAATVMDNGNPYRIAGRKNQASQLAAMALPGVMNQLFAENGSELSRLDPGSPRINEIRAQAIQRVNANFGLTEMDAGFMDYVMPTLNREWERFGQRQLQARTAYLKDTQFRMTSTQLFNTLISWDGSNMSQQQLLGQLGGILRQNAAEMGIAGEPSELERKSIVALTQRLTAVAGSNSPLAGQARRMLGLVGQIPTGQLGAGGVPMTAGELYGIDMLEGQDQVAQRTRRMRDNALEDLATDFDNEWGSRLAGLEPGSDEANAVLQEALSDDRFQDLPTSKRQQILLDSSRQATQFGEIQVNDNAIQTQLEDWENRVGSDWNEARAREEFKALINRLPPGASDARKKLRDEFNAIRKRKASEASGAYSTSLINSSITNAIKTQLTKAYPDITEAAIQGVENLEGLLAYGDSQRKAGTQALTSELRKRIYKGLAAKSAELGEAQLPPEVQQQVIDDVIKNVTGDQALMQSLLPPISTQQPQGQQQSSGSSGSSGQSQPPAAAKPQTFAPSTLDTAPEDVLKGTSPVLSSGDTVKLMSDALNGKSLPAAFKRAAKAAGMTPEQYLLRQADGYNIELTPEQRKLLLRSGNQAKGFAGGVQTASATVPQGGMSRYVNILGNLLMGGVAPAYAAAPRGFSEAMEAQGSAPSGAGIPTSTRSLSRLIGGVESFGGNYGAFNRGGSAGGHQAHGSGIDGGLTNMTIAQIQRRQLAPGIPKSQHLHAVGKYQIIGKTLRALMQGRYGPTGVSPKDRFTPEVQEKLFLALARNRVVPGNVRATMRGLRQEWIGLTNVSDARLRSAALQLMQGG